MRLTSNTAKPQKKNISFYEIFPRDNFSLCFFFFQLRMSVGLEEAEDLVADIEQALAVANVSRVFFIFSSRPLSNLMLRWLN